MADEKTNTTKVTFKAPFQMRGDKGEVLRFEQGEQDIPTEYLDHWWVRAHIYEPEGTAGAARAKAVDARAKANEAIAAAEALEAEADTAQEKEDFMANQVRRPDHGLTNVKNADLPEGGRVTMPLTDAEQKKVDAGAKKAAETDAAAAKEAAKQPAAPPVVGK